MKEAINGSVNGLPTMFSAIKKNDPDIVRLVIEYGGDPNVRSAPFHTYLSSPWQSSKQRRTRPIPPNWSRRF